MIIGYATPGKEKSRVILEAFCDRVEMRPPPELLDGAAAFYGVTEATKHLWIQAKTWGRDHWYLDNSYFDATRGKYFRATRNRLQHDGEGESDGARFAALGIDLQPWRSGSTVLICPQSEQFMRVVAEYDGDWTADAARAMRGVPFRVRPWNRDKLARNLADELVDCMAVVTHSSAAAVNAVVAGVPGFCTGEAQKVLAAALGPVSGTQFDRRRLCGVLADNQFTLEEMRARRGRWA